MKGWVPHSNRKRNRKLVPSKPTKKLNRSRNRKSIHRQEWAEIGFGSKEEGIKNQKKGKEGKKKERGESLGLEKG